MRTGQQQPHQKWKAGTIQEDRVDVHQCERPQAQRRTRKPRRGGGRGRSPAEFEAIMAELKLSYPKVIEHAVQAIVRGGCPDVPV